VIEFEMIGARGTRRWLETHAAPLVERDGVTALLGVTRDVTERKRSEQERRQMEARLRSAERMEVVGQLAGGLAHDFNNIVSIINSAAELALEEVPPYSTARRDLEEIRAAGERAAALTGQLMAFSRHQVFATEPFDLHALLLGMRSMLARIVREDVALRIAPAAGDCVVLADRGQVERVVLNLAVNARDAMPRGGTLSLETVRVTLGPGEAAATTPPLSPGSYVRLSVVDTGEGMDEQTRAHAFEPFFTTKERGRGTGLGLSSSYGIVVQSGGALTVASEPGRGSTFQVYLPTAGADVSASRAPNGLADSPGGDETILIVDDEDSLVGVTKRMLDAVGYVTLTATNGPEALRLVQARPAPIHLLVTDVVMPGMSGPELAARLAATHPETRVLFTSGYADDGRLREALEDRSAMLLGKPYSASELRRVVRDVLDARET
jgi:signal transduction histidine kinase/ActR/RegA family two-component response regulator